MKKSFLLIIFAAFALSGCAALTDVENPNVTDTAFLNAPGAMNAWLRGCERQTAQTIDRILIGAEVVSDNYFNNRTLYSRVLDIPRFESSDADIAQIAQSIERLREMADYGLQTVAAADAATTPNQRAELYFFKGLAHQYSGDYFIALPAQALGKPLTAREQYQSAVQAFQQAIALTSDAASKAAYQLALARTYYHLGDKTNAVLQAQNSLVAKQDLTRFAQFDAITTPSTMQTALYTGQDEFQPLPRLDFLDPKYYKRSATQESPICLLKSEEAFLIVAEAQLSDGKLDDARQSLLAALKVTLNRPTESVDERAEQRGRRGGTVLYPYQASVRVAASPQDPLVGGLVRTRWTNSASVDVPVISGTSVTAAILDAAKTADRLYELLYLMRQEIFMAEGRRMVDLGIKFPLPDVETDNNPQAAAARAANPVWKQGQIPSFIPLASGMNSFVYDVSAGTVIISVNMNRVIVQNRASEFVVPF